jgi:hypothetical protein
MSAFTNAHNLKFGELAVVNQHRIDSINQLAIVVLTPERRSSRSTTMVTCKAEHHNTSSRYYPATKKDHEREMVKHKFCECENEGMCTHCTSSRYVPAANNGKVFQWMKKKDKKEGTTIFSNSFGIKLV